MIILHSLNFFNPPHVCAEDSFTVEWKNKPLDIVQPLAHDFLG